MSKHIKRSGWYAIPFFIVGAGLLVSSLYPVARAGPGPLDNGRSEEGGPMMTAQGLRIGPVAGLTTAWHPAPEETLIPLGTLVEFKVGAPPEAEVTWTGAGEVRRDDTWSFALCPLREVGTAEVRAEVAVPGLELEGYSSVLHVKDVSPDEIAVGPIAVSVEPVDLDEDSTNEETMDYFYDSESIAALRTGGRGQYRTSVDREVRMAVEVDPPGFAPLIEWRLDGDTVKLATSVVRSHWEIGAHPVSVGPPANAQEARIEIYGVTIISPEEGEIIPEGEPVTFTALTDPPGYEDDITWLSSTKYGTAIPVLGQGPTFTVQFDDTWGPHPNGGFFQWLGVKADNDTVGQDQKLECKPNQDVFSTVQDKTSINFDPGGDIPPIPADFFFPGSKPFDRIVFFNGFPVSALTLDVTDTIIQRSGPVEFPGEGFPRPSNPVDIEIVQLTLTGSGSIIVEPGSQEWVIAVGLSENQSTGKLNATLESDQGGVFDATVPVSPILVFARVADLEKDPTTAEIKIFDFEEAGFEPILLNYSNVPFSTQAPSDPACFVCPGETSFFPGYLAGGEAGPPNKSEGSEDVQHEIAVVKRAAGLTCHYLLRSITVSQCPVCTPGCIPTQSVMTTTTTCPPTCTHWLAPAVACVTGSCTYCFEFDVCQ